MARAAVVTILILVTVVSVNPTDSLMQESLSKFLGSLSSVKQVRTPELLNQLCNESQGPDSVLRDACYGCFSRANNLPFGYAMLLAMSNCAGTYLSSTDYDHCQQYLNNATTTLSTRVSPTTIYCTFLECVRQVNKDTLGALRGGPSGLLSTMRSRSRMIFLRVYAPIRKAICVVREKNLQTITVRPGAEPIDPRDSLLRSKVQRIVRPKRECVGEAIKLLPNFTNTDVQLAQLFVNTTACVLAKTRCAYMNPITGQVQEDELANKLQLPSINAILVNSDYDINIVQLPLRYSSIDVCSKYRNVEQASWPSVSC